MAPPTIRGRHKYRVQPRPLTVPIDPVQRDGVAVDIANRGRTSLVMPPRPAFGAADPQAETKTGMYIFLGVIGVAALGWLAFGAESKKAPKRNPRKRRYYKATKPYFVVFPVYEDLWTKWFWRAYRKSGKSIETEGPFRTKQEAIDDGRSRGYSFREYYRYKVRRS
jgi:hypothetical protein